jgi:hypothetical protein
LAGKNEPLVQKNGIIKIKNRMAYLRFRQEASVTVGLASKQNK